MSVTSAYELGGDYRPIGVVRPEELANRPTAGLGLLVKELEPVEAIPAAPRRAARFPTRRLIGLMPGSRRASR